MAVFLGMTLSRAVVKATQISLLAMRLFFNGMEQVVLVV
jgi:hypothetical protein